MSHRVFFNESQNLNYDRRITLLESYLKTFYQKIGSTGLRHKGKKNGNENRVYIYQIHKSGIKKPDKGSFTNEVITWGGMMTSLYFPILFVKNFSKFDDMRQGQNPKFLMRSFVNGP